MSKESQNTEVAFLVEEYRHIAATHDKLRDLLARLFNYFLLLSAFPFTVAGIVFGQGQFDLLSAPMGLHALFFIVGVGHLFLTLSFVHARLSQYRYARTVNAIRKYFADKAPDLKDYLYLPVDPEVPGWEKLGHVGYQVGFMNVLGSIFAAYGMGGIGNWALGKGAGVVMGLVTFAVYFYIYLKQKKSVLVKFQKQKGIAQ